MTLEKIRFGMQALISSSIILFCMLQLWSGKGDTALYWGGLSSILGYWLPSPTQTSGKDQVNNQIVNVDENEKN